METVIKIRPAKLLLSWQFDPQKQHGYFDKPMLEEACGFIPDFFERALSMTESGNLETIADGMDDLYQCGGFAQYPLGGELRANGTYVSSYADDEDWHPYLALASLDRPDVTSNASSILTASSGFAIATDRLKLRGSIDDYRHCRKAWPVYE